MSVIKIADESGTIASIVPARGFNCFQFVAPVGDKTVDVIAAEEGFEQGAGAPSHDGIPILFPFPNRIREGRYSWDGREYQLPLTEGHPHSLHGFVLDREWRVVEQGDNFVKGQFQLSADAPDRLEFWPSDFILEVTYTVENAALTMDVTVQNPDDKPLPWGFGTHSYFKLPLGEGSSVENCLVQTPAHQEWALDECMPTGERREVSANADLREGVSLAGRKLDDVLTDLRADGDLIDTIVTDPRAGLRMVQSFPKDFRELVVFTPPWTDAVCMEPYTCVTDAINLQQQGIDAGWRKLDPGDSFTTLIVIRVETA